MYRGVFAAAFYFRAAPSRERNSPARSRKQIPPLAFAKIQLLFKDFIYLKNKIYDLLRLFLFKARFPGGELKELGVSAVAFPL